MAQAVDQIDYICQLAGNTRHCGIGSDLDGGYGREQCPLDLESIADLQQLCGLLREPRLQSGGRDEYHARQLDSPSGGDLELNAR